MNFLEDLKSRVFCRLGVSKIYGVGVFAIRDIPKGCNPFTSDRQTEFVEVPIFDVENAELTPEQMQMVKDFCPERKEDGVFDCPNYSLNEIGIAWYLNHSKTPNMEELDGDFFAIEDIKAGSELTVDYNTYGEENL